MSKTGDGEALRPQIAAWADEWGYIGDDRFAFRFPEIAAGRPPTYNPDCVWFDGERSETNAVAIFEIDEGPSRKHRVGGAALANAVALKHGRLINYFAVVSRERDVARTSIEILSRYLGDRWALKATVISSFNPADVRQRILAALPLSRTC
jgi:hypothetical protein